MADRDKDSINHHFLRENKLMLWWCIGVPVVLVALAGLLGPYVLKALNTPPNTPNAMTEQLFWTLIEQAKGPGGDTEHAQRLVNALEQRTPQEIIDFQLLFDQFRKQADIGDVWAAGTLLNRGHGTDSGFDYFRIWLIGQGQAVYAHALSDADSLADRADTVAAHPNEGAEWQYYGAAAYYAYHALTRTDIYDALPAPERKGFPESTWNWQDYTDTVLAQRLPRLWAKFGKDKQASDRAVQEALDAYQSPESLDIPGLGKVSVGDILIHSKYGPARVKTLIANEGPNIKARMVFDDLERTMALTPMADIGPLWTRGAP